MGVIKCMWVSAVCVCVKECVRSVCVYVCVCDTETEAERK